MEPVQRDILEKIESTLRVEFMTNLARTTKRDSHEQMAAIFNSFDRQTEGRFIGMLEEKNKDSADRIRSLMFVFEDLSKLDPGGIQTLLRNVDKEKLGSRSKAQTRSCATCSCRTCPSAPPRSCVRTCPRWDRSSSRTSKLRNRKWSRSPRRSPIAARSCSPTAAAKTS